MAILKFEPNVPVRLALTRGTGTQSISSYGGEIQYQWRGHDEDGSFLVFYATAALNQQIVNALDQGKIAVGQMCEITKRVNGKQARWLLQSVNAKPAPAGPKTERTPAAPPAKADPPAKAQPPEKGAEPGKEIPLLPSTPSVRHVALLYVQCYLELRNAMHALDGQGLSDEHLRAATASVFIESNKKMLRAEAPRIIELMNSLGIQYEKPDSMRKAA